MNEDSRSDSPDIELGLEIRQLISLLINQHVRAWYTKLTEDEDLFLHFHGLTEHIRSTLAGRAQTVNWEHFFLETIPQLILQHLENFNLAQHRSRANFPLEAAFLNLQTHDGIEDQDTYLMNIADALVVTLLPDDDLHSDLSYAFIREMLADLVLKTVIERLSEPWFWDEIMLKVYFKLHDNTLENKDCSWWKIIAGITSHGLQHLRSWLKSESPAKDRGKVASIAYACFDWDFPSFGNLMHHKTTTQSLYETPIPELMHELLRPSDWPLLKSACTFFFLPAVDLFAGDQIMQRIRFGLRKSLSHTSVAVMVSLSRKILFPNNEPLPSRIIPSDTEQVILHTQVQSILPTGMNIPFFSSKQINKQLLFNILDTLLGTLFPELLRRSPEQLMENAKRIRQANMEASGNGGISTIKATRMTNAFIAKHEILRHIDPVAGVQTIDCSMQNAGKTEEGLEALQAMRRSFELKLRPEHEALQISSSDSRHPL